MLSKPKINLKAYPIIPPDQLINQLGQMTRLKFPKECHQFRKEIGIVAPSHTCKLVVM